MKTGRFLVLALLTGWMASGAGVTAAQDYPSKVIRIIGSSAGNLSDFMARIIARELSLSLGPVIVESQKGGGGGYSGGIVAKAPPDGYTLLFMSDSFMAAPFLQKTAYDPVNDFAPVTLVAFSPSVFIVHPSVPANSIKELIALAKSRPGQLNYAASSTGSTSHIAPERFKIMAGVDIVRIPYKGNGEALTAVITGEAHLSVQGVTLASPHIKSGKVKALAVTSLTPTPLAPGLPPVAATLPEFEAVSLQGIVAPARTPVAIINRLNQEIVRVLNKPEVRERFLSAGSQPVGSSPEEFARTLKASVNRLGTLIKEAGIKLE